MPHKNDHELKIDSTTDQFTLVKDDTGRAMYQVVEEVPQYQSKLTFTQKDWLGGHGQYDYKEPDRYFEGQSVDTTQPGKVFLGPKINEVYLTATLRENYITGDDTDGAFYGIQWLAQTFTPASTHIIGTVKLYMSRVTGSPGTLTVGIRATDGNSKPTGADLCSGTIDGNTVPFSNGWVVIPITAGVSLTSGTKYAIVVRCPDAISSHYIIWRYDTTASTYAGGAFVASSDSGVTWETPDTTNDFMFEEWSPAATELDATPVCFFWAQTLGKWLCATAADVFLYDVGWTAATAYLSAKTDSTLTTSVEINSSATEVTVSGDPTSLLPVGTYILINTELMLITVSSTDPNNHIHMTRAVGGTTAATHLITQAIYKYTLATTLTAIKQIAEFDGVLYCARGQTTAGTWVAGDAYYTSINADIWRITDLTDCYATGFLIAPNPAGTAENIWKFRTPNQVSRTTNGQAGGTAWESPTYISDTTSNTTNIFLSGDKICVGKTDGFFWLGTDGGVHPLLPDELRVNISTDNFKYVTNWQSASYFSLQRSGGEMTTSETFRPFGPLIDLDEIDKLGTIVGMTSDRDWLYIAMLEDTVIHIYKGKENLSDRGLRWEWCPWVYLGTNNCQAIRVAQHSTTDRRLWFGYGTHTGYVQLSENPLADAQARFATSGWLRMSYTYGTDPNWDKLWQSAVIETIGGASGETVQVKYRDDTDTTATECVAAHYTNGVHEVNWTAACGPLANKRIQFEIHLASDTSTATPQVTYFQAKGAEKPTTVRIHDAYYLIGDRPSDRAKTIRTLLRTARTSTTLIKFADLRYGQKTSGTAIGDYVWCVMLPGYPKEVEIKHEKQRQPELAIQVRLQEVSFTIS